jgi:hypothetical protein
MRRHQAFALLSLIFFIFFLTLFYDIMSTTEKSRRLGGAGAQFKRKVSNGAPRTPPTQRCKKENSCIFILY